MDSGGFRLVKGKLALVSTKVPFLIHVFAHIFVFFLSVKRQWWNEQCVCVEEESSALAGFIQPPP